MSKFGPQRPATLYFDEADFIQFDSRFDWSLASLTESVNAVMKLSPTYGGMFAIFERPAQKYKEILNRKLIGADSLLPFTPLLLLCSIAASEMQSEGGFLDSNYYGRLAMCLGLDASKASAVSNDYRSQVSPFWDILNSWFREFPEFGVVTAERKIDSSGRTDWIGVPISQIVLRQTDREWLESSVFPKLTRNDAKIDLNVSDFEEILAGYFERQSQSGVSARLKKIFGDAPQRVAQAAEAEFRSWTFDPDKPEGDVKGNLLLRLLVEKRAGVGRLKAALSSPAIQAESEYLLTLDGIEGFRQDLVATSDPITFSDALVAPPLELANVVEHVTVLKRSDMTFVGSRHPRAVVPLERIGSGFKEVEGMAIGERYSLLVRRTELTPDRPFARALLSVGGTLELRKIGDPDQKWAITEDFVLRGFGDDPFITQNFLPIKIGSQRPRVNISGPRLSTAPGSQSFISGHALHVSLASLSEITITSASIVGLSQPEVPSFQLHDGLVTFPALQAGQYELHVNYDQLDGQHRVSRKIATYSPTNPFSVKDASNKLITRLSRNGLPSTERVDTAENAGSIFITSGWVADEENEWSTPAPLRDGVIDLVHIEADEIDLTEGLFDDQRDADLETTIVNHIDIPACVLRPGAHRWKMEIATSAYADTPEVCALCGTERIFRPRQINAKNKRYGKSKNNINHLRFDAKPQGHIQRSQGLALAVVHNQSNDLTLEAASCLGDWKTSSLMMTVSYEEFPADIIRNLGIAGHIEFSQSSVDSVGDEFAILPATFVGTETGFVLTGARSPSLIKCVEDICGEDEVQLQVMKIDGWPSVYKLTDMPLLEVDELVQKINRRRGKYPEVPEMKVALGAGREWIENLASLGQWNFGIQTHSLRIDGATEVFDPQSLRWVKQGELPTAGNAFRTGTYGRKYYFRQVDGDGQSSFVETGYRVAKWAAFRMAKISPIEYDENLEVVKVPIGLDFPYFLSRCIVAVTGCLPEVIGKKIIYSCVDRNLLNEIIRVIFS